MKWNRNVFQKKMYNPKVNTLEVQHTNNNSSCIAKQNSSQTSKPQ